MGTIQERLGGNVKRYRKALGLTQSEAAERAHIPFRTFQDVEYGRRWPEPGTLDAISSGLGVSASALLEDEDAPLVIAHAPPRPTPAEALEVLREALALAPPARLAPPTPAAAAVTASPQPAPAIDGARWEIARRISALNGPQLEALSVALSSIETAFTDDEDTRVKSRS